MATTTTKRPTAKKTTRKATTKKSTTPKKTKTELKNEFQKVVKGRNYFTPSVLGYFEIKDGVAELSTGTMNNGDNIYGVTIVQKGDNNWKLSESFFTRKEATDYITRLAATPKRKCATKKK